MNMLGYIFDKSSDAVFGIDAADRIVFTNCTFERLLGYSRNQLCGNWCAEVLCGTDLNGNPFCGSHCPIPKTGTGQISIDDFDLIVKHVDGHEILVNVGTSYMPPQPEDDPRQVKVFFSLRQVNPHRMLQRMATPSAKEQIKPGSSKLDRLTSREEEILGLAADGKKTWQIADYLSISTQTVRSHFKNIYHKLEVNSRIEAVLFAIHKKPH